MKFNLITLLIAELAFAFGWFAGGWTFATNTGANWIANRSKQPCFIAAPYDYGDCPDIMITTRGKLSDAQLRFIAYCAIKDIISRKELVNLKELCEIELEKRIINEEE